MEPMDRPGTGGAASRGRRDRRRPGGGVDRLFVDQLVGPDDHLGLIDDVGLESVVEIVRHHPGISLLRHHRPHVEHGALGNVSTLEFGLFKGAAVGTEAYADYVNALGGIDGRKLVVDSSDDRLRRCAQQAADPG